MFKFNNKDTRTTPIATPIVNFEHISHLLVFLLSTLNTWLPAGITWRVLIINNYTLEYPLSDWSSHLYIFSSRFSNRPLLQNICLENSIFPNYIIPISYIRTYLTLKYMHFYLYIYLYLSVCLSVLYIYIYMYIYICNILFCYLRCYMYLASSLSYYKSAINDENIHQM